MVSLGRKRCLFCVSYNPTQVASLSGLWYLQTFPSPGLVPRPSGSPVACVPRDLDGLDSVVPDASSDVSSGGG